MPAGIGVLRIGTGEFEHPLRRQPLVDPAFDLWAIRVDDRATPPFRECPFDRLTQDACNHPAVPSEFGGDLPLALAPFGEHYSP